MCGLPARRLPFSNTTTEPSRNVFGRNGRWARDDEELAQGERTLRRRLDVDDIVVGVRVDHARSGRDDRSGPI